MSLSYDEHSRRVAQQNVLLLSLKLASLQSPQLSTDSPVPKCPWFILTITIRGS